jgi:hypothetical protein
MRSDVTANLNEAQRECIDGETGSLRVQRACCWLNPPMPPHEVFKVTPNRFYVPDIENGVNIRYEIDMN